MEARDTKPLINTTKSQVPKKIIPPFHVRAKNAPKVVATPLPPLNLRYILKQCPSTAESATRDAKSRAKYFLAIRTGKNDFDISKSAVRKAASGPAARKTLVAPILPLPTVLTSTPLNSLQKINPKGMDATRYVRITYTTFVIMSFNIKELSFFINGWGAL